MQLEGLSERIRSGDRKAFETLFHMLYGQLCHYADKFLRDPSAAEELVQDTFVKIWQRRDQLDINYSIKSYLFQSVRNASLNVIKHQTVVREHEQYQLATASTSDYSDSLVTLELEERIRTSIDQLPPERRKIFKMSRDEGLRYQDIADKLGLSVKTVENQIGRALRQLRTDLSDYFVWILAVDYLFQLFLN